MKKCSNLLLKKRNLTTSTEVYQELMAVEEKDGRVRYVQNYDLEHPEKEKDGEQKEEQV